MTCGELIRQEMEKRGRTPSELAKRLKSSGYVICCMFLNEIVICPELSSLLGGAFNYEPNFFFYLDYNNDDDMTREHKLWADDLMVKYLQEPIKSRPLEIVPCELVYSSLSFTFSVERVFEVAYAALAFWLTYLE